MWDGDCEDKHASDGETGSSEPTVWDGDSIIVRTVGTQLRVPSPPCGMETDVERVKQYLLEYVPSPPCGMETGEGKD